MTIPLLTAIADPRQEAQLAAGIASVDGEIRVVRRCVDLPDVLAAAAAGLAKAVVVSADLRALDGAAVHRLMTIGVGVVGLVPTGDAAAEHRLRQFGVARVVGDGAAPEEVGGVVCAAIADLDRDQALDRILDWSAIAPYPGGAAAEPPPSEPQPVLASATGRIVAVWGPAGAPGRTTIALNLAAELAELGRDVLCVDVDSYGGTVAQFAGVLDEFAGIAGACQQANNGVLSLDSLVGLTVELRPRLRLLSGISRADRWPELRPTALRGALDTARALVDLVVVDCGFCLEQDEELAFDTAAPRRNGATLAALAAADVTIAVAAADPVGLARLVRSRHELIEAVGGGEVITVANRIRADVVGPGDPHRRIADALQRYAGVTDVLAVPDDPDAADAALSAGRLLCEVAPRSPARLAIQELARRLIAEPQHRRGVLRRLRGAG